jgi:sigma-54 specific flagellar transcriptional regulator A
MPGAQIRPAAPPTAPAEDFGIVGDSHAARQLRAMVRRVAASDVSVLVVGPSGAGKELVARGIHAASRRAGRPFVAVNCAAIPPDLLESELFGAERGAFTGAAEARPGRIEMAHGGTLFLDEIGDMPLAMQAKLLRVLEERRVARLGGGRELPVDLRLVTATHRDLGRAIARGEFREDLFFRIAVFPLRVPSLAERSEDIPALVRHFAAQLAGPDGRPLAFSPAALALLGRMAWRGNVRELRNVVERVLVVAGPGGQVDAGLLRTLLEPVRPDEAPGAVGPAADAAPGLPAGLPAIDGRPCDLDAMLGALERRCIAAALERAAGNVAEAARLLSLKRTTLLDRMRKHGLVAVRPARPELADAVAARLAAVPPERPRPMPAAGTPPGSDGPGAGNGAHTPRGRRSLAHAA